MPTTVIMPALEMAQETRKLVSWLRKEGDTVAKGQPLLEIETDKAVLEVDSPADGVLAGIKVQPGTDVPVGETIAWIVAPGEAIPTDRASMQTVRTVTVPKHGQRHLRKTLVPALLVESLPESPLSPSPGGGTRRGALSPNLRGSGPDGEILATDILSAAHKPATGSPEFAEHRRSPNGGTNYAKLDNRPALLRRARSGCHNAA